MEIELKLLVRPADLRRVARQSAVAEHLAGRACRARLLSIYYDTPQADLARGGVALRVRRTGARWVQTVKGGGESAAGLHQREEQEWDVPSGRPDLAALAATPVAKLLASPRVRSRLAPVFETEFIRTARLLAWPDGTSAELALDRGDLTARGRSVPISEVELELKSGEPARLYELAQALAANVALRVGHLSKAERGYALAGILRPAPQKQQPLTLDPSMPAAAALRRVALGCLAQMQSNEAGLLAGRDPEYLHQFRVGLRRLRSCLSLLRKRVPPERMGNRIAELRWLGQALNPARDWDVFTIQTLPPLARRFADSAGLAGLRRRSERLRRLHNAHARDAVLSQRYTDLLLSLGAALAREDVLPLAEGSPELAAPVGGFAASVLAERQRKLRKRGSRIAEATPEERHAVRIAAKRLRYAGEFFAPLYPGKRAKRYIGALEEIQDILGAVNDAAITERLLAEAADAGKRGLDPHFMAAVRAHLAAGAEQQLARFAPAWEHFASCKAFWR